ncbi:MAG: thiamine pyrophosphate-binding protein [Chloroflexota bacterium]
MRLTGGEIIADCLIGEGVPYVVGIPGHGCLGLVDAFFTRRDRLQVLQVRHEQAAVHLADGYYRASGKPLAVFTSIGPGAANTAVGLGTAYVDSTAVLVLSGETHTHMFGRGVLQEIERQHWANLSRSLEPLTKRYWLANRVENLPFVMQRAFATMTTGRPGPVMIALPMDVQSDAADVRLPVPSEHVPGGRSRADPRLVEKAAEMLLAAERPVILAGGGIALADAHAELLALAEATGAAVVTTMQGKGSFPEDHPLYGWHAGSKGTGCGNALTAGADVVFAVGTRFADEATSSYRRGISFSIPPTRLIHADIDPQEIGKNYPVAVGLVGDAKAVLADTLATLQASSRTPRAKTNDYAGRVRATRDAWLGAVAEANSVDVVPVSISRFLKELRGFLDRDAVVVSSSGNAQAQILQEFPFYVPRTNLTSGGFSTMGFSLPAAMGAKLALPERQVVAVVGDGDFLMTVQEMATAVQYNIPIVVTVLNNYGWQSIKDLQMAALGPDRVYATEFVDRQGAPVSPDFTALARAFGAYAERIERPEEVRPALARAFAENRPAVVEVIVNREQPYAGGTVAGWWDVPIPAYLEERRRQYERERSEEAL